MWQELQMCTFYFFPLFPTQEMWIASLLPCPLAYLWVWPVKIADKEIRGREEESELDCLNVNPSFSL